MIKISKKTLSDLEFESVVQQLAELCVTDLGRQKALQIRPLTSKPLLKQVLQQVNEYKFSKLQESTIPNHRFDGISQEMELLRIENTFLEAYHLKKLVDISATSNTLLLFFKKFQDLYPALSQTASQVPYTRDIIGHIEIIVDKFGEIKDTASATLSNLRRNISQVQGKLNGSFGHHLARYIPLGYLDEIKESVVEDRRVLAVKAMYRRKVKGAVLGHSKTGSIVYIEPEATVQFSRELSHLQSEEREEIVRILKALTDRLRPYRELLQHYQEYLSVMDVTAAKSKYAEQLNAILPQWSEKQELLLKNAFHPLLLLTNQAKGEKTYPQTISLAQDNRIIVISGPNAGGKSITLKTVGLLQVMLQSGMLIPVHEYSRACIFDKIITDIGDNQSIENHLSTYSYRLKNMKAFLKKCDQKTLFLIDEFGTGSDPELGGALAEAFLEVFYERESYGVITTHYANLKLLANELPHLSNANMLFDSHTLQPLFQLHLGQAGSSFTFEVAQKNGIPYQLINKAKKKVARGKIRFDKSIADLQKERSKLNKTTASLNEKAQKTTAEQERLSKTNAKIQQKLESYQQLYDNNQRLIYLGQKLNDLSEKYFVNKNKKVLVNELLKVVEIENSKRKKQSAKQRKSEKAKQEQITKEVTKKVSVIRKKKKNEQKNADKIAATKPKPILKIGDRVRMYEGRAIGTIDTLEKGKAIVNYGSFTTSVSVDLLEFVR